MGIAGGEYPKTLNSHNRFLHELYFVRHGQTEENVANIIQGHQPGG
jgi:hypothetical protein